jgi:MarR family transcriptional regulator, organic hydroperoxide resistance regulator
LRFKYHEVMATATKRSAASEAWELVNELVHSQRQAVMAIASELELSVPQTMALRRLNPDRPMAMSELAGALRCDNSNVTGIIDRLEDRGLVRREHSLQDRRVKMLTVTAKGEALRERLTQLWDRPPAGLAALSEDEQVALRDLLRRALRD